MTCHRRLLPRVVAPRGALPACAGERGPTMTTTQEPGTEIAGYRIESLIGRGGMAVVYRAEDMRLGRKVALKLLTPQLADNEQFRQRFIRESRLAASLDHPNIVPIYEAGEADGQLFIAMRYVIGSDLKGVLADEGGQLPAGPDAAAVPPDRGCAGHRPPGRARAPGRQAGQHPRRRRPERPRHGSRRPRLPHRLRSHQAHRRAVGRADRHRALPRHRRLRLARADPGQAGGPGHGHLRAGLRALRVPDRAAALPPGRRRRAALGAPGRDAPAGHGDPPGGPRGGQRGGGAGHGQGPPGPVRVLRGAAARARAGPRRVGARAPSPGRRRATAERPRSGPSQAAREAGAGAGYSLAIDLGTTFVAAAVASDRGLEMFTLGDGAVVAPAAVYVRDDGSARHR